MSTKSDKVRESGKPKPAEKPISLKPLKFEEAVEGLLRVKPSRNKDDNESKTPKL